MNAKTTNCPKCGQPAAGKFCSHCGASLTGAVTPKPWGVKTVAPWAALGIASIALAVALVVWLDKGSSAKAPEPELPPFTATLPWPGQPPDLTSMSPREAADRLFNRIMTASERGDKQEALRFVPMALQAYAGLGTLDNDARYHVALIHLTAGDSKNARVQIDGLRKSVPGHLLATMLEHQIAERAGNQSAVAQANNAFLAAYAAEIATGRAEYLDHQTTIDRFRQAAQASAAGEK